MNQTSEHHNDSNAANTAPQTALVAPGTATATHANEPSIANGRLIDRHAAAALLGVAARTFSSWIETGRIPRGQVAHNPQGRRTVLFDEGELLALREKLTTPPAEPYGPGIIDRQTAIELLGIGDRTFTQWERSGRINTIGEGRKPTVLRAGSGQGGGQVTMLYRLEEIQRIGAEFCSDVEPRPGEAVLERDAAAAYLGIGVRTFCEWQMDGRITTNLRQRREDGRRIKVYSVESLDRVKEEAARFAANPYGDGLLDREGAMELLGISGTTFRTWEASGRIKAHGWGKSAAGKRAKLYTAEHLEAVRAEFCTRIEVEAGPGLLDREQAAAFFSVAFNTFNHWECDGRVHSDLFCRTESAKWKRLYRVEYLEQKREEFRKLEENPFPPGFVGWEAAAEMLGLGERAFRGLEESGDIHHDHWITRQDGKRVKAYMLEEVERAREAVGPRVICEPSDDLLDREQAAAVFGASVSAFTQWERKGQITTDKWVRSPKGPPSKVYPIDYLRAKRDEFKALAIKPGGDDFVDRKEAARLLGISMKTLDTWERERPMPERTWTQCRRPDGRTVGGRRHLYAVKDLLDLRERLAAAEKPYPDPQRPGCYRVPIRSHKYDMEAIIDAESLPLVQGQAWNWSGSGEDGRKGDVVRSTIDGANTPLKRIVMGVTEREDRVSYANGDPLDCRRCNLVVRDLCQVARGSRKPRSRRGEALTSQYKGVHWDASRERWLAQITKEGAHKFIGRYDDEEEAARAYDQAARRLFGIHARLNFPDAADAGLNSTVPPAVAERAAGTDRAAA